MLRRVLMQVSVLILLSCSAIAGYAQNPVQTENLKAGTTDWQLTNPALNHEIEGYASLTSVNRGGQISFYVNATDANYTIDIFRTGWYGLSGGRRVMSTIARAGIVQPACPQDATTGMTECQWTNPYVLTVPGDANDPTNWASGVYLAKLTGQPSGKQSYIIFVVRDDARPSKFLFASDVTTYQAYNSWGGKSLYDYNSTSGRASKVSYNRPYAGSAQSDGAYGIGAGEYLTNYAPSYETYPAAWEYNAVRWLEKEGYDVSYATVVDLHEQSNLLRSHVAYLSFGHNEYWSLEMFNNVKVARDNGVSLGFFGSNVSYWQIRFEPSPVTGQANRTEVCYKSSNDPVTGPTQTINFRSLGSPESALVGVYYITDPFNGDIVVQNTTNWVFQGTGLIDGDHLAGLLGYEVDAFDPVSSPPGTILLGNSPFSGSGVSGNSNMSVYTAAASGATVFATGSMHWAWGLDDYNSTAGRPSFLSPAAQQITRNVLAKFSTASVYVKPAFITLHAGENQQFSANMTGTSDSGTTFTWSMSPAIGTLNASGLYSAPSTVISSSTITITAISNTDGITKGTATVNLLPVSSFPPIRVNAGGAAYTDSLGNVWSADTGFSGGNADSTTSVVTNTADQTLYKSERWAASTYSFAAPTGAYSVTLKFAEIYFTGAGRRIFNVAINGTTVLSNFDIFTQAGGAFKAFDKTFAVNSTGTITIQFITGSADLPKISAIQIISDSGVNVQVSPASANLTGGQTQQFAATVTGSSNTAVTWSMSPSVGTISSSGLYTAPSAIASQQTVTVTASSVADTTKSASATVTLIPPDFAISALPGSQTVVQGNGTSYTPTITPSNGFNAAVTFSVSGLPAGAGGTFSPTSVTGSGTSTLSVTTATTTPAGTYTVTITGTSGTLVHTTTVTLVVSAPNFSISALPGSQTVVQGNGTSYTPTITPSNGFNAAVTFSVSGLPAGAGGTFSPTSVTGSGTSTLSVTTATTTPAGTYTVTITGTSGTLVHTTTVTLVVSAPNFSISALPGSQTVVQGNGTSYTPTITPSNGFNAAVTFSVSGLPAGAGGTFSPTSVTGSGTSTLSVTTATTTPAGTHTVTITGTSGTLVHTTTVTLIVNALPGNFTPIRVNAGGAAYTDSLGNVWSADTGFSGGNADSTTSVVTNTADQTLYKSERWAASTYSFAAPTGAYSVTLKFAEIYFTGAGRRIFNVAINGTTVLSNFDIFTQAGGAFKAFDKTFAVNSTGTITIQFITGSADLPKISAIQIISDSGVNVQVSPASANLTGGQTQQFAATVTGSSNTAVTWSMSPSVGTISSSGLYTAPSAIASQQTVTVTASSVADTTKSASATVTLIPPDFAISALPGSQTVVQGNGTSYTPTITPSNGFNAAVTFSVSGLPAGAGGTFSPTSVTGSGTSTLSVTTATTTPAGTYTVTITGTSGTLVHTTTVTLVVSAPNFSISALPGSQTVVQGNGTSYTPTITPSNGFNAAVTFSVSGLPAGAGGTFSPTSVTGSGTSTLSVTTATTTPAGTHTVTITGTSGTLVHTTTVTLIVNALPGNFTPIRVNAGGAAYTDSLGNVWSADTGFSGGNADSTTSVVTNTADQTLYKSERWAASTYSFAAPTGAYSVTLKFAEIYFTGAGRRIFNVAINGTTVLSNFDIFTQAGGAFKAFDKTFAVNSTGTITIQFITGSADLPKIGAIQIQ